MFYGQSDSEMRGIRSDSRELRSRTTVGNATARRVAAAGPLNNVVVGGSRSRTVNLATQPDERDVTPTGEPT